MLLPCFPDWSSILGVVANFIAAFLPWRLWHLFSPELPNLRSLKNIGLFAGICLVSALSVAWFLAFGLYIFFGQSIPMCSSTTSDFPSRSACRC